MKKQRERYGERELRMKNQITEKLFVFYLSGLVFHQSKRTHMYITCSASLTPFFSFNAFKWTEIKDSRILPTQSLFSLYQFTNVPTYSVSVLVPGPWRREKSYTDRMVQVQGAYNHILHSHSCFRLTVLAALIWKRIRIFIAIHKKAAYENHWDILLNLKCYNQVWTLNSSPSAGTVKRKNLKKFLKKIGEA